MHVFLFNVWIVVIYQPILLFVIVHLRFELASRLAYFVMMMTMICRRLCDIKGFYTLHVEDIARWGV